MIKIIGIVILLWIGIGLIVNIITNKIIDNPEKTINKAKDKGVSDSEIKEFENLMSSIQTDIKNLGQTKYTIYLTLYCIFLWPMFVIAFMKGKN